MYVNNDTELGGNGLYILKGLEIVKTISLACVGPLLYNPSNKFVYVSNHDSNTVSVINGNTNRVIAIVSVGSAPMGLAYDPSNQVVYVANFYSSNVSVIRGTKLVMAIEVGGYPSSATYDPSNKCVYVGRIGSVSVINGTTDKVIANVKGAASDIPGNVIFDPANKDMYFDSCNTNRCFIFDINSTTNKVVTKVSVSTYHYYPDIPDIAFDPTNMDIYFSLWDGYGDGYVGVLSPSNTLVTTVSLPYNYYPSDVIYNPSNAFIYVSDNGHASASVISS